MPARTWCCAALLLVHGVAASQLRPEERKGIADSLSIANLGLADLRFERKPFGDPYRLPVIEKSLDDPLSSANTLLAWHASSGTGTAAQVLEMGIINGFGERPVTGPATGTAAIGPESKIPVNIQAALSQMVGAIQRCDATIRRATANLTTAEKRALIEGLPVWAVEEPKVRFSFVKEQPASQRRLLELLKRVDLVAIRAAGLALTTAAETCQRALTAQRHTLTGMVRENIAGLPVEIGGVDVNVFSSTDARLTIDLGGSDQYRGRGGAGVGYAAVQIDLGGHDLYDVKDLSTGAAVLGVGVAIDRGGHDRFRSGSLAFGAGLAGVGVFEKHDGDDAYSSSALAQGFGFFGIGLCLDTGGDDRYELSLWGQGAARTQGLGWLVDRAGRDDYRSGGLSMNEPLFTGVAYSNAQGFASGYREDTGGLSGGVGMLTDHAGDDGYRSDTYAQAASYWFSLGSLYDAQGNDDYVGHHYVQASAMHCCGAYLFDLSGSDAFVTQVGASLAIGHDYGVAFFLDRAGDDLFSARDSTPGVGVANGLGIFVDAGGSDRYDGPPGQGNAARGTGSLGVFVDLDGLDKYRAGIGDGLAAAGSSWGTALDLQVPVAEVQNPVEALPAPNPGTLPMPPEAEMVGLYAKATQWGVGSAQQEVKESTDRLIGIGVPAFEWMLSKRLEKADRLQQRLFVSVAKALGSNAGPAMGDKALHGSIPEKRNLAMIAMEAGVLDMAAVLPAYLQVPELRMVAARASGPLKAKACLPTLMQLCLGSDALLTRAAMVSMLQIGDESAVGTGQALLKSSDMPTRLAALQLLTKFPVHAKHLGDTMIMDTDESVARTGMRLIASLRTEEALRTIGSMLLDPRPGVRIEALLLLEPKCPPDYKAAMDSLHKDPDDIVRAVARRIKDKS